MKPSLTIFFPCYNDAGTIATMIVKADSVASKFTTDYEIIVIDDGSTDTSRRLLLDIKEKFPKLKIIFHEKNKGYGGVLKTGFREAKKELIFYTDGDAQYDVYELETLFPLMKENIDIVNGYKIKRHDPLYRIIIGYIYQYLMKLLFQLKIQDVDCDFRLMRKKIFDHVELKYDSGVICVEMIKKIQEAGFKFAEVGVHHYFRSYGKSRIFNFRRILRISIDLIKLWIELIILKKGEKR